MRHDPACVLCQHGIAQDISAEGLRNVFAEFWPVIFQPLSFFRAAHEGVVIADELIRVDLWLNVAVLPLDWTDSRRQEVFHYSAAKIVTRSYRKAPANEKHRLFITGHTTVHASCGLQAFLH